LDDTIDQGIANLEKAAVKDPDAAVIFASLAEADWMKRILTGDDAWLERSREASRQAELRYPDTGTGHRAAGLLHVSAGRFEEAEAELSRAVELEPANAENFRRLAFVYQRNNQDEQALISLRKAVDLQPNYYKNQYNLGDFFLHQARYREAVEHLEETVKLTPGNMAARFDLAMAYTDSGKFEDARRQVNYLLQLGKSDSARFQWAKILMYEGKDREAIPYLREALKIKPSDHIYLMHLGIAQRRTGDRAESLVTMRKALALAERKLALNARDAATRSFLGYYCSQLGQRDRAESDAAQAIQLAPKGQDVIWMTVLTFEALGERDAALAKLRLAPVEMLGDLKRWPDMADLTADPRFIELLAGNADNREQRK
jgi:Flp pilus assembly protein TadD